MRKIHKQSQNWSGVQYPLNRFNLLYLYGLRNRNFSIFSGKFSSQIDDWLTIHEECNSLFIGRNPRTSSLKLSVPFEQDATIASEAKQWMKSLQDLMDPYRNEPNREGLIIWKKAKIGTPITFLYIHWFYWWMNDVKPHVADLDKIYPKMFFSFFFF